MVHDEKSGEEEAKNSCLVLSPGAIKPQFQWSAKLPLSWAFIDTHPACWEVQIERVVDDFYGPLKLKRAEQKLVREQLARMVKMAQDQKVLLLLVLPGAMEDGAVSACTFVLKWHNFSGKSASMALVDQAYRSRGEYERKTTPAGVGYGFFREEIRIGNPLDPKRAWNCQAIMPITGTSWVVMASGTAPNKELGATVEAVVLRVIESIRTYQDRTDSVISDEDIDVGMLLSSGNDVRIGRGSALSQAR